MMAAKDLVSRCLPLVIGGNCVIFIRKSWDFWMADDKFLNSQCDFIPLGHVKTYCTSPRMR